jgi:hypothetical protein
MTRYCGNYNCKNYGKTWDVKHHTMCPFCIKEKELKEPKVWTSGDITEEIETFLLKKFGVSFSGIEIENIFNHEIGNEPIVIGYNINLNFTLHK